MTIGIVTTVQGWAGSEELWYDMARAALAAGHKIILFLHEDARDAEPVQRLQAGGAEVRFRRTLRFSRLWSLKEKVLPSFSHADLRRLDRLVISLGSPLDIFYVPGLLQMLVRREVPYIPLCQFNADGLAISPAQRALLRSVWEKSAGCCFVSRHNLELAERQMTLRLPSARIVDNPVRHVLPSPLPWPAAEPIKMACVARFDVLWKGQDLLLEVLGQPAWKDRPWTLSFFGSGRDEAFVKQAANFYGLADRVRFPGYVRDLDAIWREHHLMVLPSRGEGLPLAVLEAMMCGRPTVATDAGGNSELVEESITGFLAEAATPHSLGAALERAWSTRGQWEMLGQEAHRRARHLAQTDPAGQLLEYVLSSTPNTSR